MWLPKTCLSWPFNTTKLILFDGIPGEARKPLEIISRGGSAAQQNFLCSFALMPFKFFKLRLVLTISSLPFLQHIAIYNYKNGAVIRFENSGTYINASCECGIDLKISVVKHSNSCIMTNILCNNYTKVQNTNIDKLAKKHKLDDLNYQSSDKKHLCKLCK